MVFFFVDWKVVDERLIRCGELLLGLDFLDGYGDGLEAMNRKKVGNPYRLTNRYVEFLAVLRYLFFMPSGGLRTSLGGSIGLLASGEFCMLLAPSIRL